MVKKKGKAVSFRNRIGTVISLLTKLPLLIYAMLRSCWQKVRLLPAFVVTMSDRQSLKRKFKDISEMASDKTYAAVVKTNATVAWKGVSSHHSTSGAGTSGQANQSRQATSGRDERKHEQAQNFHSQRQSGNRGGSAGSQGSNFHQNRQPSENTGRTGQSGNRGGGAGSQGSNFHQNRQPSENTGRTGNNNNWNKAGGRNQKRNSGKGGGSNAIFNRNQHIDKRNMRFEDQELESSTVPRQQGQGQRHQTSTNTTQRSRHSSESKDNSFQTNTAATMSHSPPDKSRKHSFSETPKKHLPSGSEEMHNQASNLTSESIQSSGLANVSVPETSVKDLSLSDLDPAIVSVYNRQEEMDSQKQSKKSPGWSDLDSAADRKNSGNQHNDNRSSKFEYPEEMDSQKQSKKPPGRSGPDPAADRKNSGAPQPSAAERTTSAVSSSSKPENTVQRNARPEVKDTRKVESQESEKSKTFWKGVPLSQLKRAPECLRESESSQAAINEGADYNSEVPESQKPMQNKWKVVPSFVLLPHQNTPEDFGPSRRWQFITDILNANIYNYQCLEEAMTAIAEINPPQSSRHNRHHSPQRNFNERLDFRGLQAYFKTLTNEELNRFFHSTLPKIQKLALELPNLFQEPLPILKQRVNQENTLTQQQVACLLANAFFNTFPQRPHHREEGKPLQLPDFNFINLYGQMKSERKVEKLKCIVNYFQRVTENMPDGKVTYRRVYGESQLWLENEKKLTNLHVSSDGTIEDARGFLQADFANKFVGGGVLNTGLVQEEIRFVLCPEMILSRLFTEMLVNEDVLVMIGCERFSSYSGYSDTFKFTGNYFDDTERDSMGRKYTEVVAMDASVFRDNYYQQFEMHHVKRELNKAYIAFESKGTVNKPAVCTGNWGCGAFGGDKQLKALIQLMAASVANRDICYLTFGDNELCMQIGHIYDMLKSRDLCIKDIMAILEAYSHITTETPLFTFIERQLTGNVNKPEKSTRSDFPKNENVQSKSPNKKK